MSTMKRTQAKAKQSEIGQPAEAAQDAIYRWLKQHVLALPSGEASFLTEAEVCRAIGKSRTPVREAMLRLESDGLLRIIPKKGAYVPPITEAEVESVMQARALIEGWCVGRVAELGDHSSLDLERLVARQKALQNDPVAFIECDREFHRTIVRAAGNPVLADFYESLRDRQLRMGWKAVATSKERTGNVLAEHKSIIEALYSGDAKRAEAAMTQHLSNTLAALGRPGVGDWARGRTEATRV
jgi:DNA-binding GntR family transcriptional regulator